MALVRAAYSIFFKNNARRAGIDQCFYPRPSARADDIACADNVDPKKLGLTPHANFGRRMKYGVASFDRLIYSLKVADVALKGFRRFQFCRRTPKYANRVAFFQE